MPSVVLGVIALVLPLLWPLVGALQPGTAAAAMQVICTAHGAVEVPLDDAPAPLTLTQACALCAGLGIGLAGTPSVRQAEASPTVRAIVRAAPVFPRTGRSIARPRAPPVLPSAFL